MTSDVSIIIPTYKRPEKLARALSSVAQACSLQHEIFVIDDCPDGSAYPVAMQFKAQYFCKSGQRRGLSRSRNIGIDLSGGKFLLFLDDDDYLLPSSIDALHHHAMSGGYSVVFGDFSNLFPNEKIRVDLSLLTHDHLLICNQIPVGAYMMERSSIRQQFDERMRSHEDWDFLLCNMEWQRCKHVPIEVVTVDKTENLDMSMQARRRQYFWLDFIAIYSKYPAPSLSGHRKNMLLGLGIDIDESMLGHADTI